MDVPHYELLTIWSRSSIAEIAHLPLTNGVKLILEVPT
jgi:hypothetical protein